MEYVMGLVTNKVLLSAVAAWFIAQGSKIILGKDEVGSSNLPSSSIRSLISQEIRLFWYFLSHLINRGLFVGTFGNK